MVANVVKLKLDECDSANVPHVFKFGRAKFRNLFPSPRCFTWQQTKLCRNRKSIVEERMIKGAGGSFCIVARFVLATLKESTGGA